MGWRHYPDPALSLDPKAGPHPIPVAQIQSQPQFQIQIQTSTQIQMQIQDPGLAAPCCFYPDGPPSLQWGVGKGLFPPIWTPE